MTFGNKDIGTFTLGRNFGLLAFDAIINDMTLPGVGVAGSASTASPSNTTLGSIGFGYLYPDTLAQIDTRRRMSPIQFHVRHLRSAEHAHSARGRYQYPKKAPGFQYKATYTYKFSDDMKLYVSTAGLTQKQDYSGIVGALTHNYQYTSNGEDIFIKFDAAGFEVDASYYNGKGLGTTGLFFLADDGSAMRANRRAICCRPRTRSKSSRWV